MEVQDGIGIFRDPVQIVPRKYADDIYDRLEKLRVELQG